MRGSMATDLRAEEGRSSRTRKTNFTDREIGSIKIKILTNEWYAPNIGLIKSIRVEETDTDLFGTTKMVQVLDEYKF